MELDVYKIDGSKSGKKITLSPEIFEIEPNDHAIYMDVRVIQANARQGTHKVKPRNEVRGGGKKPFRQKKTGRARQGTSRSPLNVGGGSIFGPHPHDYKMKIPAKMKKLARKSALSYKARENAIVVIEDFSFNEPKTKQMAEVLKSFSLDAKKTLLLTTKNDNNVYKSGRNMPKLSICEAAKASTFDLLNNKVVLMQHGAVEALNTTLGN
jgi:large subunit ribosomal protein L4